MRRPIRRRQLRHIRARILARNGAGDAQCSGEDQHRQRAVSRLGRSGAGRGPGGADPGRVHVLFSQAKPLVDVGKVRALAVAAPTRIPAWPDVPTFKELGFNIDFRGFVGVVGAGQDTEADPRNCSTSQLNEVVQSKEFKSRMAALGMAPPPAADNTPEKYDGFLRQEIVRQGEIAKLAKAAEAQ